MAGHNVAMWQFTVQYSTVQYSTVQYSTVQYSTVQYSTVQYSTVQYSTVQYSTVQYSTVQYSTVQYSTVQYSTVQYSTVQYSTVQYSTVQYSNRRGGWHGEEVGNSSLPLADIHFTQRCKQERILSTGPTVYSTVTPPPPQYTWTGRLCIQKMEV